MKVLLLVTMPDAFRKINPGLRRSPLSIVFCDPQIAMVGQAWRELEVQENVVVGKISLKVRDGVE
jgi:hypothetical protein